MVLPISIASEAQKLSTDRLVKLYEIDATDLGGVVFRFCNSIDLQVPIDSVTTVNTLVTLNTSTPHLLENGDTIRILNSNESVYNGDHLVTKIDYNTITFNLPYLPTGSLDGTYVSAYRVNNVITFNGNDYTPIEIEVTGFEWDGKGGSLPTPKLLISNKHRILMSSVIALKDLIGAKFTRIRTFRKHLDDGTDPDVNMIFPKEIFRFNRKSAQNKIFMEFELASSLDQEGVKIPGGQCLRNTCLQKYRVWKSNISAFDYTKATCPYVGSSFFRQNGTGTLMPEEDRCGKHLSDCVLRFGNNTLPIKATPGIGGR